jgi:4-hydroxybenzoate polyprenyltransferase
MTTPHILNDAISNSWVNRMPVGLQPYLQLARLDRPIGTWLLYWPCVCGLFLAMPERGAWPQTLYMLVLFFVGAVVMRGAGCAYNDIIDRDIDAKVARTAGRPLPSGRMTVRGAWVFVVGLCCVGLLVLVQLNTTAIYIAVGSIFLVAAYPFMKRITWWPQAWLGFTFNWGALVGYTSISGEITWPALLLYGAGIFWTLGYDSIYAFQDIEDDAFVGVKSSARALGVDKAKRGVSIFYAVCILFLAAALIAASGYAWLGALALPVAVHFYVQVAKLKAENGQVCLALFRSNRDAGALMALACAALGFII